ncbi:serine protease [Lentzea sp. NPDC004782]|uniref:S1 family peptidase n=1 Tax=Lentzea sp. NPDC004782 TaxID=3154458 RepID=UPI0033B66933
MGYAEMFAYHVMPITRARRDADGNYDLLQWVGTGFTFGEGTFVTCWHCVGAELPDDEVYLAVGRRGGVQQSKRDWPIELQQLARDTNGADLALARIEPWFSPRLALAADPLEWGDDVVAFGFPHTLDTIDPETNEKRIETHARVFKGYVTRLFPDEYQGDAVVELAMPAPVGMSGGPLFNVQRSAARGGTSNEPFECFGVVFGERIHQTPDGEIKFGTALRLDTLRNATAEATNGLRLAEYLTRTEADTPEVGNTARSE